MKTLRILGDSIMKGIQFCPESGRYETLNSIDFESATGMNVENYSKFGCTVPKCLSFARRIFIKNPQCNYVLMDLGGNDSDYDWAEICKTPDQTHLPYTYILDFITGYQSLVRLIREYGACPVMTTLPQLDSQRYIDWTCQRQNLDRDKLMSWLGDIEKVTLNQYLYSETAAHIARANGIELIDLRSAFNSEASPSELMGPDGIHPNDRGQTIIRRCISQYFS